MRNKRGFTLVELLVVMAIIAILAAIVVPNAARFIGRARVTRALSEIQGMETAITAITTDAGRSNLGQIFIPGAVPALACSRNDSSTQLVNDRIAPGDWPRAMTAIGNNGQANFDAVIEMYSSVTYDLLRYGRDAMRTDGTLASDARAVITTNILSKLGTSYMDLGNDSWGSEYRILPGPWKVATDPATKTRWPIIFRKFSVDTGNSKRGVTDDPFSLKGGKGGNHITNELAAIVGDEAATFPDKVGFPADTGKPVYIWSLGENMRSGQMLYAAAYDGNAASWYPNAQDASDIGGGDDVNNWDKDSTWSRFSN